MTHSKGRPLDCTCRGLSLFLCKSGAGEECRCTQSRSDCCGESHCGQRAPKTQSQSMIKTRERKMRWRSGLEGEGWSTVQQCREYIFELVVEIQSKVSLTHRSPPREISNVTRFRQVVEARGSFLPLMKKAGGSRELLSCLDFSFCSFFSVFSTIHAVVLIKYGGTEQ